ncbi:GNAT family N-acetyltransferase [Agrobacterium sp.]|uniref:GNAT family N-acetyltransferase n=1 Tax=Agrobacterium sp. TaxID=361 RepID=UPI0028A8B542|nr:GNAT family N-acetyltransferase [Agrobacterium sp.]
MSNTDITIRAYRPSDLHVLSSLWFNASLAAHAFLGEQRLRQQQQLVETIYLPKAETWVACMGEHPVGFIGLIDHFIGGLFVSPSQQGKGIGRALLSHALALKGELSLDVYADNHGAHLFYLREGFREISRNSVDDEGLPFPTIRMIRSA